MIVRALPGHYMVTTSLPVVCWRANSMHACGPSSTVWRRAMVARRSPCVSPWVDARQFAFHLSLIDLPVSDETEVHLWCSCYTVAALALCFWPSPPP
jgi:hypothetical protein